MPNSDRRRVVFHAAIIILVGLFCGFFAVLEEEPARLWHTAHEALILIGVLQLGIAAAMPLLALPRREAQGLVWSLLLTGYGFMIGVVLQGFTGMHAFGPSRSPVLMVAFIGNAIGIGASITAACLTIMGAVAGRRANLSSP